MPALTALLLATLAAPGLGKPAGLAPTADEREAQALLHEIQVHRTVAKLQLSDAQKWALLPILKAQVQDEAAIAEAQARALPQVEPAMRELRAAVLANQGVSDELKKRVRDAEAPFKKPKKALEQTERERIHQVWQALTTRQAMALRGREQMPKGRKLAEIARGIAQAPDPDAALARLYRRAGLRGAEIERAVAHGREVLRGPKARPAELGRRLLALPDTGILEPRPERGLERKLKRLLLSEAALRVLDPGAPRPADFEPPAALRATVTDVQVMNLINTLYLPPQQARALARIGRDANAEIARLHERRQALARRSLPTLRQARDLLARGEKPSPELRAELQALRQEQQGLEAQQQNVLHRALGEARAQLDENQLEMIATFVPCTVPVQSLTNPERVGQVSDNSGIERGLERLRKVPAKRVDQAVARVKARVEERHRHKHRSDEEIARVVADVDAVVAEARAMDDAQFEVRKQDLARRLAVPDVRAEGRELDKRIVRYLLSPNLAPILESRAGGR